MRFVQFVDKNGGPQHLGVQLHPGDDITNLSAVDSTIPNNLKNFLEGGDDLLNKAKRLVADAKSTVPEANVSFLAPVTGMDKLACVGLNYRGHCKEQGVKPPTSPVIFSKFPSTVVGPNDDVIYPSITKELDWEVELAIVIGKRGKSLSKDEAEEIIFGYTVAQDISARDLHKPSVNGGQNLLGKAMDTFCPLGPVVVTKDAIPNVDNLSVKTWVNGKIKQDGNTNELIFGPGDIVAYLSRFFTLLPGDVILTGTPGGVGFGRKPPEFLKIGDVLETEIENIGRLCNNIV